MESCMFPECDPAAGSDPDVIPARAPRRIATNLVQDRQPGLSRLRSTFRELAPEPRVVLRVRYNRVIVEVYSNGDMVFWNLDFDWGPFQPSEQDRRAALAEILRSDRRN